MNRCTHRWNFVIMTFSAAVSGFLYYRIFSLAEFPGFLRIGVIIVAAGSLAVLMAVFIQRVKEIKGGEEDDLGEY